MWFFIKAASHFACNPWWLQNHEKTPLGCACGLRVSAVGCGWRGSVPADHRQEPPTLGSWRKTPVHLPRPRSVPHVRVWPAVCSQLLVVRTAQPALCPLQGGLSLTPTDVVPVEFCAPFTYSVPQLCLLCPVS